MRRSALRTAALLAATAMVAVGCSAGPSSRPGIAEERPGRQGPATSTSTPPPAPALSKPKTDLGWKDCTRRILDAQGLGPGPAGLLLECADITTPVDPTGSIFGTVTIGLMRARLPHTPADAPPLVLTSGFDRASGATLAALAVGPSNALLSAYPLVSIDRRLIGASSPIDCMSDVVRRGLDDHGQFTPGDPADAMAELSQKATTKCKDDLQPQELALDARHAAEDIEQLRLQWQLDRVGLIGVGNGAVVATSYAAKFPARVARLVLDSPSAFGASQSALAEQRAQGGEAALTAFAQRCVTMACSLGPDPRGAVVALVRRAASGQIPGVSANAVLTGIRGFLGSPRADQSERTAELADAISAPDGAALRRLINTETLATRSDGQFIARCSDEQQRASVQQARDLRKTWGQKYPVFGDQAALGLIGCTAWPTAKSAPPPRKLDVGALVLSGAADPVSGNGGLSAVSGALNAASVRNSVVTWQGWGHPVLTHSGCAQQHVVAYLKDAALPQNGAACPA